MRAMPLLLSGMRQRNRTRKFSQMVWWIDRESAARAGAKIKSTKAETIAGVGSLTVIVSS
jgi:hypothetical protein